MRRISVVLLLCVTAVLAGDNPDLHQAIQIQEDKMAAALSTGNSSLFASFYDPHAHLMLPGDDDYVGRDAIASAVQGLIDSGVASANFTAIEVNYIHKFPHGWAYERGAYVMYTADGQVFDNGSYVVVWSRSRDQHQWYPYYDITVSSLPKQQQPQRRTPQRPQLQSARRSPYLPAPEDKLVDAITGANLVWMAAYDSADAAGVAACYTSNATVLPDHNTPVMGTAAIQSFFQGAMTAGVAQIELTIVEVNVAYDDNIAYEKSTYVFKDENGNVLDTGKYIVIWSHEEGSTYKLYIDCFNSDKNN